MAEDILSAVLCGEVDAAFICSSIKNRSYITCSGSCTSWTEFVRYFLSYIHEKATPSDHIQYLSPKKIKEPSKDITKALKLKNGSKRKSAQSLSYGSSSPLKTDSTNIAQISTEISGVSPIKPSKDFSNKQKKFTADNFELSSFDDFPLMSMAKQVKSKVPRRITATPVAVGKTSLSENVKLEDFSCFDSFNSTTTIDISMNKLFIDNKRFSAVSNKLQSVSTEFNKEFPKPVLGPTELTEKDVLNKMALDTVVELYIFICSQNLVTNFTVEFYFLFSTLTIQTRQAKFSFPFDNVAGCIYFAVNSLSRLKKLLVYFDVKTLQLVADNIRVHTFATSDFLTYLRDSIDSDSNISIDYSSHFLQLSATGIPFQIESDNRKSFRSDKHFYSFSKQRDAFYALVREWQENHNNSDFNLQKLMVNRVPQIIINNNELNTHYQFAKLFVAQLLEMCRDTVGSKPFEIDTSDSTLLELKKRYPEKFKSLQDRLTQPSLAPNPCPMPSFSLAELFFCEFIQIADSFYFNKYLIHILFGHITDLNKNSIGIEKQSSLLYKSDYASRLWQDIQIVISELRILAKFLGLLVFLPYKVVGHEETNLFQNRDTIAESLQLQLFIEDAYNNHHLLITIPWIVEFFSMTDKYAFQIEKYQVPLHYMFEIYCSQKMLIFSDKFSLLNLALLLHLGWLFELPHIHLNLQTASLFNSITNVIGIDDLVVVDKNFLYALCPFLSHTKKPLLDFANGNRNATKCSFRKITPVRTNIVIGFDTTKNLKNQLLDSFFRYLSKRTKDCLLFVTERHFANIKHYFTQDLIPCCCQEVVDNIKKDIRSNVEVTDIDSLKLLNSTLYTKCFEDGKKLVALKCDFYLKRFLKEKVAASVQSLLPESFDAKFISVAGKVVTHNVCSKVQEWLTANRELYVHGVEELYNRYVKNLFKMNMQSNSFELSDGFSLSSESSLFY